MTSTDGGARDSREWGRRAFNPARRRTLRALVEAMFSSEEKGELVAARPELADRVVDEMDLLIGAGSPDLRRGFRFLTWLIDWLPLVVIGTFSRASRLPLARRLAFLEGLEHGRIGLLATLLIAFKLPLTMIVFEVGPELRLTGFDRETISTRRLTR